MKPQLKHVTRVADASHAIHLTFDRELTDAELAQLEKELAVKYAALSGKAIDVG